MVWDTLLVNGTDLSTAVLGTRKFQVWEGIHTTTIPRGQDPSFAGIDGETFVDRPFPAGVLSLGLIVRGSSDVTGFNDAYRELRRLCPPDEPLTLTRRLSYTSGNESHTTTARLRAMTPSQLSPADYRVALEFTLLEALWYGTSSVIALSSGVNTGVGAQGDVRSQKMTITLTGGTTPGLSNAATGHELDFTGSMSSPVVIDVLNQTATQGATDVSQYLTWTKSVPFALRSGVQQILVSGGGTASISYSPAYL
jgi:hypothetical protein